MRKIIGHLRHVSKVLLGGILAGRNLTVFPDDVFIVSYPRSGNTWIRFLVGNLVYGSDPVTFLNIDSRIPSIYAFTDRRLRALARPRILKSHEYFDPRYGRVIYIVRDPRDVAVSDYHFNLKWRNIPDGYLIDQFVSRFIAGEFDQWQNGACWGDQVLSWLATRQGKGRFLMLRYEDLLRDAKAGLSKLASFLDIDRTPEKLSRAIELSSLERMRLLEKKQAHQWVETKRTRQDKPFVRAAASGNWKSILPEKSVVQIEAAWGSLMQTLGYELSTQALSHPGTSETAALSALLQRPM